MRKLAINVLAGAVAVTGGTGTSVTAAQASTVQAGYHYHGDTVTLLLEPVAPYQARKPRTFVMTVGPTGKITGMRWSSWSRTSARGSGTLHVPEAGIKEYARVHLYRDRHLKMHARYYTRLTLSARGVAGRWRWQWFNSSSGEWTRS